MLHLSAGSQTLPTPLSNNPVVKRQFFGMRSLEMLAKQHRFKQVLLLFQLLLCLHNIESQVLINHFQQHELFQHCICVDIQNKKMHWHKRSDGISLSLPNLLSLSYGVILFTVGIIRIILHWRLKHIIHLFLLYPSRGYFRFCRFLR